MNKINQLFESRKDRKLLSLYFCAGCPTLEGTGDVIKAMERHGIDMIEVGIPFSDPLADGPVISECRNAGSEERYDREDSLRTTESHQGRSKPSSCADGLSQPNHALWHRGFFQRMC